MRANIFIHTEDEEKWKALPNKSEFVRQALNGGAIKKAIKSPSGIPSTLGLKPCVHGFPPAFCRFARNGKSCGKRA